MFPDVVIVGCTITNGSKDILTKRARCSILVCCTSGMRYQYCTAADNQLTVKAPEERGRRGKGLAHHLPFFPGPEDDPGHSFIEFLAN